MSTKQKIKEWRKQFNDDCRKRDNYKCRICGKEDNLDVHHITDRQEMPNYGYVKENGITLCPYHHNCAEVYHNSGGKIWDHNMHPDDLYKLIASSKEEAIKTSKKLS